MTKISVVSGTINRLPSLKKMVQSVRDSVQDVPYEIILVDCNSQDGTRSWIREQKDCVLIEHDKPRGSAVAFQDGFKSAQGEYVFTSNDDVYIDGAGLKIAHDFLDTHLEVGQVAFGHKYQNRKHAQKNQPRIQSAFGYPYGQCCLTRKYLGEWANWTGLENGWTHYAWDSHLSMSVWSEGYRVVHVPGCAVVDFEIADNTRKQFSDQPRALNNGVHPDTQRFMQVWKGVLPPRKQWVGVDISNVLHKAANGTLRVLRFKGMMAPKHPMRHGMIDAWAEYGTAKQINQSAGVARHGEDGYQNVAIRQATNFRPDLILFQSQRPGFIAPATMRAIKQKLPNCMTINWDGDTHYPMLPWHAVAAQSVDLMLTITPDLFEWYCQRGAHNIGYWPISVEPEYLTVDRNITPESLDVVFLGTAYSGSNFPERYTRVDAIKAISKSKKLSWKVWGRGWNRLGIKTTYTNERHLRQAQIYANAKMALSISQTSDYWGYTSDRLYNISASQCAPLVKRFRGMEEHGYVDGETCIVWSTMDEMVDKALYYKEHDQERESIAAASRQLILDRHLWSHRIQSLFTILGDGHGL